MSGARLAAHSLVIKDLVYEAKVKAKTSLKAKAKA